MTHHAGVLRLRAEIVADPDHPSSLFCCFWSDRQRRGRLRQVVPVLDGIKLILASRTANADGLDDDDPARQNRSQPSSSTWEQTSAAPIPQLWQTLTKARARVRATARSTVAILLAVLASGNGRGGKGCVNVDILIILDDHRHLLSRLRWAFDSDGGTSMMCTERACLPRPSDTELDALVAFVRDARQ
jgi:hypothetical protein